MAIILKRGLEANRAATAVAEGELLFSRDTGRLYIGSGSGNLGGQEIKFNQLTASSAVVQNVEAISRFLLQSAGGLSTANSIYSSRVSSGSLASPTETLDGQYTAFQMQTFGGSTWSTTARMLMQTSGNHLEDSPTNIIFATVTSGSSALSDRFKINGLGVQVTGSLGVTGNANIIGSLTSSVISASVVSASNLYSDSATFAAVTMSTVNMYVSGLLQAVEVSAFSLRVTGSVTVSGSGTYIKNPSMLVTNLASAASVGPGAMANVTDATVNTRQTVVAGGGSNIVMVYSNGTDWIIL